MKLTREQIERAEELEESIACQTPGCYHYSMSGIIYCVNCMHGGPAKLPEEDIAILKTYRGIE